MIWFTSFTLRRITMTKPFHYHFHFRPRTFRLLIDIYLNIASMRERINSSNSYNFFNDISFQSIFLLSFFAFFHFSSWSRYYAVSIHFNCNSLVQDFKLSVSHLFRPPHQYITISPYLISLISCKKPCPVSFFSLWNHLLHQEFDKHFTMVILLSALSLIVIISSLLR